MKKTIRLILPIISMFAMISCRKAGCTDATALNYDPEARADNGTCIAKVYGCTDPESMSYNANANTDDGNCEYGGYMAIYSNGFYNDYINISVDGVYKVSLINWYKTETDLTCDDLVANQIFVNEGTHDIHISAPNNGASWDFQITMVNNDCQVIELEN